MPKKNIIIYGAGNNLLFSYCDLDRCYNIVAVTDGNPKRIGEKFFNFKISDFTDAINSEYDMVVITPANNAGIRNRLEEKGIEANKIFDLQDVLDSVPDDEWEQIENIDSGNKRYIDPDIAIVFYGGLGNLLIGRDWLRKIIAKYKMAGSSFDIFLAKDIFSDGRIIFRDTIPKENIYDITTNRDDFFFGKTYSVIFRFCIVPEIWCLKKQSENLINPEFLSYVIKLYKYGRDHYNRGFFPSRDFCKTVRHQMIEKEGIRYHTAYDIFNELEEVSSNSISIIGEKNEDMYLSETGIKRKKYITLNTGLNREYLIKRNTRAWPFKNWKQLAIRIKEKYPDLQIVQVGIRMREEDDIPADVHLNGKTNLEQISIILKHALIHVDYDGGLVHVRHMMGGKSIVLMGPSATENHAYPENEYIQTYVCEPCEWITPDWLSVCVKGYDDPPCMESITVDMVLEKIDKLTEEA